MEHEKINSRYAEELKSLGFNQDLSTVRTILNVDAIECGDGWDFLDRTMISIYVPVMFDEKTEKNIRIDLTSIMLKVNDSNVSADFLPGGKNWVDNGYVHLQFRGFLSPEQAKERIINLLDEILIGFDDQSFLESEAYKRNEERVKTLKNRFLIIKILINAGYVKYVKTFHGNMWD